MPELSEQLALLLRWLQFSKDALDDEWWAQGSPEGEELVELQEETRLILEQE